jgi:hypothetical protein
MAATASTTAASEGIEVSAADRDAIVEDTLALQAKLMQMAEQLALVRGRNQALAQENTILKDYKQRLDVAAPPKPS